jgi:hypothetical protein
MIDKDYVEQMTKRAEFPLGPRVVVVTIHGREIPLWLRNFELFDRLQNELVKVKVTPNYATVVAGRYEEQRRVAYYFFVCMGMKDGKIDAFGKLAFPEKGFEMIAEGFVGQLVAITKEHIEQYGGKITGEDVLEID